MEAEKNNQEEPAKARFEFRSFGQHFENAAKRMARLSMPVPEALWERSGDELYILSRVNNTSNVKIREEKIDIKTLVQTVDGLEQWQPLLKASFPVTADDLVNKIFPAWEVFIPDISKECYEYREFIAMVDQHPQLQKVQVHKTRYAYMVNNTICESGTVLVNGAAVSTIACESSSIEAIQKTLVDLELEEVENINYIQAIKRIIGLIDQPLAN